MLGITFLRRQPVLAGLNDGDGLEAQGPSLRRHCDRLRRFRIFLFMVCLEASVVSLYRLQLRQSRHLSRVLREHRTKALISAEHGTHRHTNQLAEISRS